MCLNITYTYPYWSISHYITLYSIIGFAYLITYNRWDYPEDYYSTWAVYNCAQNPAKYMPLSKKIFHKFTDGQDWIVDYAKVHPQSGECDCGLYALAYAIALAMDIQPGTLILNQPRLRDEFNYMIEKM